MSEETDNSVAAVSLSAEGVVRRFGPHEVLRGISFDVKPSEIFVIMGPSGAGKSVLLRTLVNLEMPNEGKILLDGRDNTLTETHEEIRTALVFQDGALLNSLTVWDNLAFYPREHRLYDKKQLREKVQHTLDILNLKDAADKMPSELSGGMRKRVAIARALVMEPQAIFYDEPTSELDPVTAANITEIIGSMRQEFSVTSIVVSHDRELALSIADRVALLMDGQFVTISTPEELAKSDDPRVRDFMEPNIDPANPRFRRND